MRNNIKKIIAAALAAVCLSGCTASDKGYITPPSPSTTSSGSYGSSSEETPGAESQARGTYMSLTGDGNIEINRNVKLGNTPMGKEGTWTIFVYLCGSNLESECGFATSDMEEMLAASTGENVRFVVETGGAYQWYNNMVDSSELGRFEICNGQIKKVDKKSAASMGAADTLADFLKWGVSNYPAAHMGVVLWNHGGGSISGVCLDETWNRDLLGLTEIDAAFAAASEVMTDKFEFVGFDACLMATVECANILAPYADYMYGSEELESGFGWDYAAIGNYLGKNPKANGEELGRVVCDSFFNMLEKYGLQANGTLSVTDLSKIDELIKSYHAYTKELDSAVKDIDVFSLVVREINDSEKFGSNNKESGYINLVDLAGIVSSGEQYSNNAKQVLNAIDKAVVYSRKGEMHQNSCGLSTYYPLSYNGQTEIEIFSDIAVTPYYLSFVTRTVYGLAHNGNMSGYVEQEIVDEWSDTWSGEDTSEGTENYWDNYANAQATGDSKLIKFEMEPGIYDGWQSIDHPELHHNGSFFGFVLTEESEAMVAEIRQNLWITTPDGKYLIEVCQGYSHYVGGSYRDEHRFSIHNGTEVPSIELNLSSLPWDISGRYQPMAAYYLTSTQTGGSTDKIYIIPVLINNKEAYLWMKSGDTPSGLVSGGAVYGIWDGITEDGVAERPYVALKEDDVITPRYNAISLETGEATTIYGESIFQKRAGYNEFESRLKGKKYNTTYYTNYEIVDVFGDSYVTDFARYEIADGKLANYKMVPKDMLGKGR